jgi:hypothetical protein
MIRALGALLLATSLVAIHTTSARADDVPRLNIQASCRDAMKAAAGLNQDMNACLQSENNARDQLAMDWSKFAAADRSSCLSLTRTGTSGTYTELLTCLEMKRDARRLPKEQGTVGSGM